MNESNKWKHYYTDLHDVQRVAEIQTHLKMLARTQSAAWRRQLNKSGGDTPAG
ncbi:MAG: hypothetical protein FWE67_08865 [Planctomycetaceae bacterium]|nr:hypothetical protein [Planctomycetaceae bacterium]